LVVPKLVRRLELSKRLKHHTSVLKTKSYSSSATSIIDRFYVTFESIDLLADIIIGHCYTSPNTRPLRLSAQQEQEHLAQSSKLAYLQRQL
jgi:hypothetical protein